MIKGIGIDVIDIDRFRNVCERWGRRLLDRVFSERELEECLKKRDPVPHLAVRFAAKEAFSKALGSGFGAQVSPKDIEVMRNVSGPPMFLISGDARHKMEEMKSERSFLSLSHDGGVGIAFVILEGEET